MSSFVIIQKLVFLSLLFFLPFGTRTLLTQFSQPFVEYEAVFWYAIDFLALAAIALVFRNLRKSDFLRLRKFDFMIFIFFAAAVLSVFAARDTALAVWRLVKLGEMLLLFFAVRHIAGAMQFRHIAWVVVASAVVQAVWGIGQFAQQNDFNLQILGESPLDVALSGVAKIGVEGATLIRAYGSFPHPNILAAFLVTALFLLAYLVLAREGKMRWWSGMNRLASDTLYGVAFFILFLGLFLTFSRAAWLAFLFAWCALLAFVFFRKPTMRWEALHLFLFAIVCGSIFVIGFLPFVGERVAFEPQHQDVVLRLQWTQSAWNMIQDKPLLGVGIGNFVSALRAAIPGEPLWFYQPVHNLYALIAAETGFAGLASFLALAGSVVVAATRRARASADVAPVIVLFLLFAFFFLGAFDHYFWTIQQGQMLFWAALGLCVVRG